MNKIHIVYLCARFHPYKGGAEVNTYQLATRMAAAGHQVTVVTTDASPDGTNLPLNEVIEGVNVIRVHRWNQALNLGFYPRLLTVLLNLEVDVIHYENGPGFIWQEWCLIIKRVLSPSTKFIATPHGGFLATNHHQGIKRVIAQAGKFIGNFYFRFIWSWLFHRVIAVNPHQYHWMGRDLWINQSKIVVIPNGIPGDMIVGQKFPIDSSAPIFITTVGRMEKYKGAHHVISALAKIKDVVPQFHYLIMGKADPHNTPFLRDLINELGMQEQIELIEAPSDQKRDQIMSEQSQISILFSEWEATGIVLLEAMAKGNVIITSDTNEAAPLLIDDGVNGYIVEYPDTHQLADRLRTLLENSELRYKMTQANLEKIRAFTWEQIFPDYLKLIHALYSI